MADEIDIANQKAAVELQRAIEVKKPSGPGATGFCHNCGEKIGADKRWCDADCRNDWELTRDNRTLPRQ